MDTSGLAGDRYFRTMSWVFLVLVFIGFAPSFYLGFLVDDHPLYPRGLPWAYIVHGVALTGWYLLFVVQSSLIVSGNRALHKRLGTLGAAWAAGVLATTWWAISIFPNRMQELALDTGRTVEEVEPGLAGILWLDVFMSLLFLGFVAGGVIRRNRRREHRRLMLFAGLAFLFAAVFRLSGMVGQLTGLAFGPLLGLLILVLLWGSVLVHDRRKEGRILAVTWTGFTLYWLSVVSSFVLGGSAGGEAFILGLFS
jgi:hypothetical protein